MAVRKPLWLAMAVLSLIFETYSESPWSYELRKLYNRKSSIVFFGDKQSGGWLNIPTRIGTVPLFSAKIA